MSIEVKASYPCPHLIMEETVTLGVDRRTVNSKSPIAGSASVRILVNDSAYIPSGGLYSQAVQTSSKSGPYRIQSCENLVGPKGNYFTVTTEEGSASVSLPLGERVPLETVQRTLRLSSINNLVSVDSKNGALSLTDRNEAGSSSEIHVSGEGADALGFEQTGARGREIYPPWQIIAESDTYPTYNRSLRDQQRRYVKFVRPLRTNPTLKMTYTAMPNRCLRCGGTYVENDWRFNTSGEVITIENENLLYQACLKAVLTVRGSNPYHVGYGSKMTTRIGRKLTGAAAMLIRQDVQAALTQVKSLQSGQRKYQSVTNREMLYKIENVDVRPSQDDPTVFFVDVSVRNAANRPIRLSTVFSVPGTIALAGSNNKPLGLDAAGLSAAQSRNFLIDG